MDPRTFAHAQYGIPTTGGNVTGHNPFAMGQSGAQTYSQMPNDQQPLQAASVPYGSGAPSGAQGVGSFANLVPATTPHITPRGPSPSPASRHRSTARSTSMPPRDRTNSRERKRREQIHMDEPLDAEKLRDWITRPISCETTCRNNSAVVSQMQTKHENLEIVLVKHYDSIGRLKASDVEHTRRLDELYARLGEGDKNVTQQANMYESEMVRLHAR